MDKEKSKIVVGYSVIPDDQKVVFKVTPKPGSLLKASLVGSTIRGVSRLLKACSDDPNADVETFITGLSMHEDGSAEIQFAILARIPTSEVK